MIPSFHFGVSFIAAPVKENEWFPKREQQQIFIQYTHYENTHTHTFENNNSKDPKICLICCLIWCWPGFTSNGRLLKIEASQQKQTKYRHMRRVWNRFEATYSTTTPQHSRSIPPGFFVVVFLVWNAAFLWGVGRVFARFSAVGYVHMKGQVWSALWLQNGFDISLYILSHLLRFGIWTSKNIP